MIQTHLISLSTNWSGLASEDGVGHWSGSALKWGSWAHLGLSYLGSGGLDRVALTSLWFVRTIIKSKEVGSVLSQNTRWPWVNVVGVTAAEALFTGFLDTALGHGHTEQVLLRRQINNRL